jgi:RNA polymerase sigma factor (sigma-70 family)
MPFYTSSSEEETPLPSPDLPPAGLVNIVTPLVFRLVEFVTEQASGERLEQILRAFWLSPMFKETMITFQEWLVGQTDDEWNAFILDWLSLSATLLNRIERQSDPDVPYMEDKTQKAKALYWLKKSGCRGGLKAFAIKARKGYLSFCRDAINGTLDFTLTDRAFYGNPDARGFFHLMLTTVGNDQFITAVEDATELVLKQFIESPVFSLCVELMENSSQLADYSQSFEKKLSEISSEALIGMRKRHIHIPPFSDLVDNTDDWPEERSLALRTVYYELKDRVDKNPEQVLADQYYGKLSSSLCLSVINDAKDVLKYLHAKKRDSRVTRSLDNTVHSHGVDGTDSTLGEVLERTVSSQDPSLEDNLEADENYRAITACLDPREKEIIDLKFVENMPQKLIAMRLRVTESCLSKYLKKVYSKIRLAAKFDFE